MEQNFIVTNERNEAVTCSIKMGECCIKMKRVATLTALFKMCSVESRQYRRYPAGPRAFSLSGWRAPGLIRVVSGVDWLSLSVDRTLPCARQANSAPHVYRKAFP